MKIEMWNVILLFFLLLKSLARHHKSQEIWKIREKSTKWPSVMQLNSDPKNI